MKAPAIRRRLSRALDSLPQGIVGINNHMGSAFTESSTALGPVMDELKRRQLFFVDSVTTRKSVAFEVARRKGLRAARRNFEFIDNKRGVDYSTAQFKRLIARTRTKKALVTIMHDRKHSVMALTKMLAQIRSAGIEVTYASDLLEGGAGAAAAVASRSD